ncbi:hypothetical protein [Poritiphilus flavus]|uniref:Uncharacterized protein n=1 Tax=Poritiphilus flavus TaxID=2697053 RepID=A0A6L9EBN9_9FLAO|nr:hypothetical protein [Poritiphilus flavus]NAS12156.1 hypothetical protein [Poritiphilus flavus]
MKQRLLIIFLSLGLTINLSAQNTDQNSNDTNEVKTATDNFLHSMGGKELWKQLKVLKFQHIWYPSNRESYVEDEIIDLTATRSWVKMKSEVFERIRAYSPEFGYWSITNGKFAQGSVESMENALKRGPFNMYRIIAAIAREDKRYEFKMEKTEVGGAKKIAVYYQQEYGGGITINYLGEPIVWETLQYKYTFGPMESYGNLRHPKWALYNNGSFRYEMVFLVGSSTGVDVNTFKNG